ncbi:hypothetical protein ACLOJK_006070 [Asimina triloba]
MASPQLDSEPAKIEQIITEFFSKSLHIILESRSPYVSSRNYSGEQIASSPSSSSSSSSVRPRDKWFNLALRECPAALENLDFWRQSYLEPLIVDVVLVHRSQKAELGPGEFPMEVKKEKVIERWFVQYERRRDLKSGGKKTGGISSHCSEQLSLFYKRIYKRSIILMRSLLLMVRLLPAYKLFRDLNSTGQIKLFGLTHKVSSFVEPFTRREEAEMQQFVFNPVDTCCGRLCLSVMYRPKLLDVNSELSTPISTNFIMDYVGSPTTDPLRRFPSHPLAQSPASPSPIAFARRHSWSNELHMAAMPSASPSPTYSNSSHRLPRGHLNMEISPPSSSPHHPLNTQGSANAALAHKKTMNSDESWPSLPFSPSPTPSPPTHLPSMHSSNALLRTESAPMSIPSARIGINQGLASHVPPPFRLPKVSRPSCSPHSENISVSRPSSSPHSENIRTQGKRTFISQSPPPEGKYLMKQGPSKSGESPIGVAPKKVFSLGKEEALNFTGPKISSSSSPRFPLPRSSSRLPFQDDFDDPEFSCPFAADDDDIMDPSNRYSPKSSLVNVPFQESDYAPAMPLCFYLFPDGPTVTPLIELTKIMLEMSSLEMDKEVGEKYLSEAAVGALISMLKTAPPLHQECSKSAKFSEVLKAESLSKNTQDNAKVPTTGAALQDAGLDAPLMTASRLIMLKTTADALEELNRYRDMKDLLLRQGGHQSSDAA